MATVPLVVYPNQYTLVHTCPLRLLVVRTCVYGPGFRPVETHAWSKTKQPTIKDLE